MSDILLSFDRPLHDVIVESPRGVIPTITTIPDLEDAQKQQNQTNQMHSILQGIESQLSAIADALERTQLQTKDLVLQFSTNFTELFFSQDKELVQSRLNQQLSVGLNELNLETKVSVWVHPDCLDMVKNYLANHDTAQLAVGADSHLTPGDCRLEGPEQGLVGRLERQLEHVRNSLLNQLHEGAA